MFHIYRHLSVTCAFKCDLFPLEDIRVVFVSLVANLWLKAFCAHRRSIINHLFICQSFVIHVPTLKLHHSSFIIHHSNSSLMIPSHPSICLWNGFVSTLSASPRSECHSDFEISPPCRLHGQRHSSSPKWCECEFPMLPNGEIESSEILLSYISENSNHPIKPTQTSSFNLLVAILYLYMMLVVSKPCKGVVYLNLNSNKFGYTLMLSHTFFFTLCIFFPPSFFLRFSLKLRHAHFCTLVSFELLSLFSS